MCETGMRGRYYAKDGMVWKEPVATKTATGHSITIGFPVCRMHEAMGNDAAEIVATLMNIGQENSPEMAS